LEASRLSYKFGEFTLYIARGCVFRAGVEIKLRPKVYETLKYLVKHPGQLIGKQELMQAVWPSAFVTDDLLVRCALELRRALDQGRQKALNFFSLSASSLSGFGRKLVSGADDRQTGKIQADDKRACRTDGSLSDMPRVQDTDSSPKRLRSGFNIIEKLIEPSRIILFNPFHR
jgi:hypothetical protein